MNCEHSSKNTHADNMLKWCWVYLSKEFHDICKFLGRPICIAAVLCNDKHFEPSLTIWWNGLDSSPSPGVNSTSVAILPAHDIEKSESVTTRVSLQCLHTNLDAMM